MQIYKSVCISIALLISILRMYVVSLVIFHCWNPHCFSPLSVLILFRILLATIFILSHFPWDHLVFMHQYGSIHPYVRGMATITDFNSLGMYLTLYISFKKWVMVWIQYKGAWSSFHCHIVSSRIFSNIITWLIASLASAG